MPDANLKNRLGKRAEFDSLQQETAIGLLYVADRIENRLGRLFREHGLTNSQYNVLRILRGEGEPLPALEVAKRMIRVVPAITGLVDRLEKQGMVTRQRCEEDRRVVYIELTRQGAKVLAKIDEPLKALHQEMLSGMTKNELTSLRALLSKATASVAPG